MVNMNSITEEMKKELAFTEEELARFFEACDNIVPYKGRPLRNPQTSVPCILQAPVQQRHEDHGSQISEAGGC